MIGAAASYVALADSVLQVAVPDQGTAAYADWTTTAPNDTYHSLTFKVADLDRAAEHLKSQGVGIRSRTEDFLVTDPDTSINVPLGIHHPPGAWPPPHLSPGQNEEGETLTSSSPEGEGFQLLTSGRRQAVEVRGSPARLPGSLPAQSRRAPPRCSWPRSRQRCRRNRRQCTGRRLGSRATSRPLARTPSTAGS